MALVQARHSARGYVTLCKWSMRLRGGLLGRGLPTGGVSCVQAAIRLPALLLGAWWREGWGRRCWLTEHVAAQPPDRLCLGEHLSPRYLENATSSRNLGRKSKQFAIWKSGLTPLPGMGGRWRLEPVWTRKKIHMGQYTAWKRQEGITECSFKSGSLASNFLY